MKARGFADPGAAELLLSCLSARTEPGYSDLAARASRSDWSSIVDVAVREHVAPLLFKRLKESDARTGIPTDAWKRLRQAYFTSGDRNTRLYRELRTVLECLRSSGVKVIVLKGAYLAVAVYGDVALRPMCDADLLVSSADLARAEGVLLDMGGAHLKQHNQAAPAPRAQREDIEPGRGMKKHALPVFIRDLAIELHWTIVSPTELFRIDAAGLWDRARPATIAGVEVLALSPEDLLLHLCLHVCSVSGCVGLRYVCDIAETIRHFGSGVDWPQIADRAREWGAPRYVGLALHLARSLLAVPVPESVLDQLVPGGLDPRLLEQAIGCVLAQERYRRDWALLTLENQWSDKTTRQKVKALREAISISRDQMASRYPRTRGAKHLWPYYIWRPVDLLRKYGRATLLRGPGIMRTYKRDSTQSLARWLRNGKP